MKNLFQAFLIIVILGAMPLRAWTQNIKAKSPQELILGTWRLDKSHSTDTEDGLIVKDADDNNTDLDILIEFKPDKSVTRLEINKITQGKDLETFTYQIANNILLLSEDRLEIKQLNDKKLMLVMVIEDHQNGKNYASVLTFHFSKK